MEESIILNASIISIFSATVFYIISLNSEIKYFKYRFLYILSALISILLLYFICFGHLMNFYNWKYEGIDLNGAQIILDVILFIIITPFSLYYHLSETDLAKNPELSTPKVIAITATYPFYIAVLTLTMYSALFYFICIALFVLEGILESLNLHLFDAYAAICIVASIITIYYNLKMARSKKQG